MGVVSDEVGPDQMPGDGPRLLRAALGALEDGGHQSFEPVGLNIHVSPLHLTVTAGRDRG